MIWKFEGGPWDGNEMVFPTELMVPAQQIVNAWNQPSCVYDLVEKQVPATYIYRPRTEWVGNTI
jgi:hypothetical protein